MNGIVAPQDTNGYFEVEFGGKTLHSKSAGQGFVDTRDKLASIIGAIEAEM